MGDVRRRIVGVGTPDETPVPSPRDASPARSGPQTDGAPGEHVKVVPADKLEKIRPRVKGRKRRNAWVFALGALVGVIAAGLVASSNGGLEKLVDMVGLEELNLDTVLDVLPMGFIKDMQRIQVRHSRLSPRAGNARATSVG
jgi:phospholipid:diacylglycerol acyltransferase